MNSRVLVISHAKTPFSLIEAKIVLFLATLDTPWNPTLT